MHSIDLYKRRMDISVEYSSIMNQIYSICNKIPERCRTVQEFRQMLKKHPVDRKELYRLWKEERRLSRISDILVRRLRNNAMENDRLAIQLGFGLVFCEDVHCDCNNIIREMLRLGGNTNETE